MAKCKHETKNGRCGLKESYAYGKECHTEEFCRCHDPIEPCIQNEPMTNADRIRAMSDEELKQLLCNNTKCEVCKFGCWGGCSLMNWLKQPAGEV